MKPLQYSQHNIQLSKVSINRPNIYSETFLRNVLELYAKEPNKETTHAAYKHLYGEVYTQMMNEFPEDEEITPYRKSVINKAIEFFEILEDFEKCRDLLNIIT